MPITMGGDPRGIDGDPYPAADAINPVSIRVLISVQFFFDVESRQVSKEMSRDPEEIMMIVRHFHCTPDLSGSSEGSIAVAPGKSVKGQFFRSPFIPGGSKCLLQ